MAVMGAVPVTDEMPYWERYQYGNPGWGMSPVTQYDLPFDSYNVPFACRLVVRVDWGIYWNNRQQLAAYSNISVPTPPYAGIGNVIDAGPGRVDIVVYTHIAWDSLAAGQAVSVNLRAAVGGGGSPVWSDQYTVISRAYRL